MLVAISCSKEYPEEANTLDDSSGKSYDYEIPVDEALNTLNVFLESEGQQTKSSALKAGDYSVEKWTCPRGTKGEISSVSSVYCVDFSSSLGSAILAADKRMSEKIFCVSDTKISVDDLDLAMEYKSEGDTKLNSRGLVYPLGKEEVLPLRYVGNAISSSSKSKKSTSTSNAQRSNDIKYGPLLMTKWGQEEPFNTYMNGAKAKCGPVAAAQLIYYFRDTVCSVPDSQVWDWEALKEVRPYTAYYELGSPYAQESAARFMLEVKYQCNYKPEDTHGCIVGDVEKCLRQFGFQNVKHDFAHFGGDGHDIQHIDDNINYMIKCSRPVIMLGFSIRDFSGHVYVLDGYKKDSTGEYLHINWGWEGKMDGYYSKGCFDESWRAGIEEGFDNNTGIDSKLSNFDLNHYYIYYDM